MNDLQIDEYLFVIQLIKMNIKMIQLILNLFFIINQKNQHNLNLNYHQQLNKIDKEKQRKMISHNSKPYSLNLNRIKNNQSPYDNLGNYHNKNNTNRKSKNKSSNSKPKIKNNHENHQYNLYKQTKTSARNHTKKDHKDNFKLTSINNNQNNPNFCNIVNRNIQLNQENNQNLNKDSYKYQSQQQEDEQQQISTQDYIKKIKSTHLSGQRNQNPNDPNQDFYNIDNFHPSSSQQEQQYDTYEQKKSKMNQFLKRKLVEPKQKYWPVMEQIQEVAGDMITTSQRKPGQSSKKQFKDLKQKSIKSHRDQIKNSARLKSNNFQPVHDLNMEEFNCKKSIQLDNKVNLKLSQKRNSHVNNKSYSSINPNYIYTQGNSQIKKELKYKKPSSSLPKRSGNSKSEYNLNNKVKHMSIQSEARKKKQSLNSVQYTKPNDKKKYLSLSSKSKELDKQKDRNLRDSNSKGRSNSKNSIKTHKVCNKQKIKITAYQQLQNRTQKNEKNIKMLWSCIGQLWQQTRINQYVSQKNQTKVNNLGKKFDDQQENMIQLKVKTSQLVAAQLKKNARI